MIQTSVLWGENLPQEGTDTVAEKLFDDVIYIVTSSMKQCKLSQISNGAHSLYFTFQEKAQSCGAV